jgi:hypothetical protein
MLKVWALLAAVLFGVASASARSTLAEGGEPLVMAQTLLPFSSGPAASAPALVIPAVNNATTNWGNAGLAVIGGYPTRTTQCGSTITPSGITPPNASDDFNVLTAAIASCTAGDFISINGTLVFAMSELPLLLNKSITLRGVGTCNQTSSNALPACPSGITVRDGNLLTYAAGGNCGVNTSSIVSCNAGNSIIYMSPTGNFDYGWNSCGHTNPCNSGIPLAADAAQGDTTIQVTQTSSFAVGQWVLIDEASGATWQNDPISSLGLTWAAPEFNTYPWSNPSTARAMWSKHNPVYNIDTFSLSQYPYNQIGGQSCGYGINCDRYNGEMHLISSIGAGPCPGTNCTLTFDSPLTIAFRQSGGAQGCVGYISAGSGLSTAGNTLTLTGACASGGSSLAVDAPLWYSGISGSTAIWYITAGSGLSWTVSNGQNGGSGGTGLIGTPGSPVTFSVAAHNAQVSYIANQSGTKFAALQQAGVENMSLGRGPKGGISMQNCMYCWAKNLDIFAWAQGAINIEGSARDLVDMVYLHDCSDCENNGAEYAYSVDAASTETLIQNSIITFAGKSMVFRASGGGNVVSYNVCDITFYMASIIGNWFLDHDCNASHYLGSHHVLFEGNYGATCGEDNTHGSNEYEVYYRNWCVGLRTNFNDPSFTTATSTTFNPSDAANSDQSNIGFCTGSGYPCTQNGPLRSIGMMAWDYGQAFVGNVLGKSGVTTAGNGWAQFRSNFQAGYAINLLGWNNVTASVTDPNLDGTVSPRFIWLDGNYDYLSNSVTWVSGAHTLPNSLYLPSSGASAPSFFGPGASCTYPWPWVTPTSGTQIQSNSCSGSGLPAKARFDAGTYFVQP